MNHKIHRKRKLEKELNWGLIERAAFQIKYVQFHKSICIGFRHPPAPALVTTIFRLRSTIWQPHKIRLCQKIVGRDEDERISMAKIFTGNSKNWPAMPELPWCNELLMHNLLWRLRTSFSIRIWLTNFLLQNHSVVENMLKKRTHFLIWLSDREFLDNN